MKLTVGPLPAGVYWRRRAIVGGALLIVVLMLWAQCSGPDPKRTPTSAQSPTASSAPPATADPAPTIQTPTTGDPVTSAPPSSSAPAVASTVPVCADADLSLVASPEQPVQFRGAYLKFFLKIKNTSAHDCTRDLGADFQELYLQVGAIKMWSSDHCDPPKGSQPTTLKPGIEVSFSTTWNGKTTNNGCVNREVPPAGKYELVGRLDTKLSTPVQVHLT